MMDIILMRRIKFGSALGAEVNGGIFLNLVTRLIAARDESIAINAAIAAA